MQGFKGVWGILYKGYMGYETVDRIIHIKVHNTVKTGKLVRNYKIQNKVLYPNAQQTSGQLYIIIYEI